MNPVYDWDDIDDYVLGSMSDTDRQRFEELLATDVELARRVAARRAEPRLNRLLRNAQLLEQLHAWEMESARASSKRQRGFGIKGWWGVVVLLLIVVMLLVVFRPAGHEGGESPGPSNPPASSKQSPPVVSGESAVQDDLQQPDKKRPKDRYATLRKGVFIPEDFLPIRMGTVEDSQQSDYPRQAASLYAAGNYAEALDLLILADSSCQHECLYLKGYTLYQLERYEEAEAVFRSFRNYSFSARKLDAQWCEVFCMVQQLPGARPRLHLLLEQMSADAEHPYSDKAAVLLSKLSAVD